MKTLLLSALLLLPCAAKAGTQIQAQDLPPPVITFLDLSTYTMTTDASVTAKFTLLAGSTLTWTGDGNWAWLALDCQITSTNGVNQTLVGTFLFNSAWPSASAAAPALSATKGATSARQSSAGVSMPMKFRWPVQTVKGNNAAVLYFASNSSTNYALVFSGQDSGTNTAACNWRVERR